MKKNYLQLKSLFFHRSIWKKNNHSKKENTAIILSINYVKNFFKTSTFDNEYSKNDFFIYFCEYKDNLEQIDDVCIIRIKYIIK